MRKAGLFSIARVFTLGMVITLLFLSTAASQAQRNYYAAMGWRPHFVHTPELTVGFGLGSTEPDYTGSITGITYILGYAFTDRLTGGAGSGVYFYNGGSMVPVFLDFRYRLGGNNYKPFLAAKSGVLLFLADIYSSGAFINPSIGIDRKLTDKLALHLTAGPLVQHAPEKYRSSFIVLRAGVTF